jgi:hypothetical protein
LLAAVLIAGCSSRNPAAFALMSDVPTPFTGTWEGVVGGREIATSSHVVFRRVVLRVDPDGSWAVRGPAGVARGHVTRMVEDGIVLEGRRGEEAASRPVRYRLHLERESFLVGSAGTYFRGHGIETGISLRRKEGVPAGPGAEATARSRGW